MSRYIDADVMIANALQDSERLYLESVAKHTPSIDLDDYVPKEFHDKTCEAMAKSTPRRNSRYGKDCRQTARGVDR